MLRLLNFSRNVDNSDVFPEQHTYNTIIGVTAAWDLRTCLYLPRQEVHSDVFCDDQYTDEKERQGGLEVQSALDVDDGISQAIRNLGNGKDVDLCISAGGDGTFLRAALSISGSVPCV